MPLKYILIIAFFIRFIFSVFIHTPDEFLYSDMKNYHLYSKMILEGIWGDYHFFQPIGYSLILSGIKALFLNWGIVLGSLQALFSTLTIYFLYHATRLSFGEKMAQISSFIGLVHIPWIIFSGFVMTETFFTFCLSLLLWLSIQCWQNPQKIKFSFFWGLTFMMAFFLKGTHVFLVPIIFLFILINRKKKGFFQFILPTASVIISLLFLHGFFTFNTIGKFQMSASAGGLNLMEGKCPIKWNKDSTKKDWLSPMYFQLEYTKKKKIWDRPFTDSSFFMKEGLKCIVKYPGVLIQSLEGIPLLFTGNLLWPINQMKGKEWFRFYELSFGIFIIVGIVLSFIFLYFNQFEQKRLTLFTWVLPIMSLFVCVYIFKSEIRFRIPFDVFFIPLCLAGWNKLFCILKSKENLT